MSDYSKFQPRAPSPAPSGFAVHVAWFTGGLVIFGLAVAGGFFLISSLPIQGQGPPIQIAGVVLLLITAAPAIYALRKGKVALGSGLLVGYAIATAFSSGQCTLWVANSGYEIITAFFVYLLALGVAFVIFIVAMVVDATRQ